YGSAEQLGEDLRRYRAGLPVRARPDRWSYRTGKFLRRHWRGLTAAGLMTLTLAAVVSYYSWQLVEERNRAVEASARAEMESSKSVRVTDFLQQIFAVSNPSRSLGESVTARELLDRGAAQIEAELAEEPEIQASLMEAISESYAGLGLFEEAETQAERSFELRRTLYGPPHEALASSHERLGELRIYQGRYEEAEKHFREALEQFRQVLDPEDPRIAENEGSLGAVAHTLGRLSEAEERYRRALAHLEVRPGPRGQATLLVQSNLVTLLYNQKRLEEAEELGRRVLVVQQEVLGRNHPDTINTEGTLAAILVAAGRHDQAEPLLRTLWQRQRELLGEEHPDVALAANNLAAALFYLGRYDEAEPLYESALAVQEKLHGMRHVKTVATLLNLADLRATGRHDDEAARGLYEQALALRRTLVEPGSFELLNPLISLGELELRQHRPLAAVPYFREAAQLLGPEAEAPASRSRRWRRAEAQSLLGEALLESGEVSEARVLLPAAVRDLREELGKDHPKTLAAERRLRELPR
ncbi:MAG: tetratricopeptide repeat protein, partial [Acidobacteria bacterium]|nr:tetratricopeptide repeat protein [Acidobacteriota bacterium]